MEKCKLINIRKSRSGNIVGEIELEPGKSMPVPSKFILSIDMNNKECEIERVKGQPVKIIVDGNEIDTKTKKKEKPQKSSFENKHVRKPTTSNNIQKAHAPYNFVPLNHTIVNVDKPELFNKYYGNTGYIEVKIETKTPVYIRSAKGDDDPDFYQQAGKYRIPGSSLRGMLRTIIEIISWSKFGSSQVKKEHENKIDKKFFYRKFTDKSNDLEKQYRENIVGGNIKHGVYNKTNAGYIKRKGIAEYEMIPAKNEQFYRVEDSDVVKAGLNKSISESSTGDDYKLNPKYQEKIIEILFTHEKIKTHNHTVPMKYAKVTSIRKYSETKSNNEQGGYLICSGYIGNKRKGKHMHWVIGPKSDKIIRIPKDVIENFNNDWAYKKRISGSDKENPIKGLQISKSLPCFFVTERNQNGKDVVKSFGFTGHYRIPYEKTLHEYLTDKHNNNTNDITESIFGQKSEYASRVFFEDFFLNKKSYDKVSDTNIIPKTLSEPKPTSFQLYLEQDVNNINPTFNKYGRINRWNGIKSYNDNTIIRGNKLYWHKYSQQYKTQENFNKKIDTKIKPIREGAQFSGRIRFENLTDIELGALLFVLDLPKECCHKIGMGKPVGLGSIKITPELFISNRKERYKKLFSEWDEISKTTKKTEKLKKDFEEFILEKIDDDVQFLWETKRLKELRRMLDFEKKPDDEETKYMEFGRKPNGFTDRRVLPRPTEI